MIGPVSESLKEKFEFVDYHNAGEILAYGCPNEWKDIIKMLDRFDISCAEIATAGGSETAIPGKVDAVLRPLGWKNMMIAADLSLRFYERKADSKVYDEEYAADERSIYNFVKGPHVEFLKNRVAVCVEWNKKDVDYDRCLAALKIFFDLRVISAGVVFTRSEDLEEAFSRISLPNGKKANTKYSASSTHMNRLITRLDSNQAGGCPVLAVGIKSACVRDLRGW